MQYEKFLVHSTASKCFYLPLVSKRYFMCFTTCSNLILSNLLLRISYLAVSLLFNNNITLILWYSCKLATCLSDTICNVF